MFRSASLGATPTMDAGSAQAMGSMIDEMLNGYDIQEELVRYRNRTRQPDDFIIDEVERILAESTLKEQDILNNLKSYNAQQALLSEEGADEERIFKEKEIKALCVNLRLKFLESHHYKSDVPYEAILRIKHLNDTQKLELREFRILAPAEGFGKGAPGCNCLLFTPTRQGNYYLVHSWGEKLKWYQKIKSFPMRSFENLLLCLVLLALTVTMSLPTFLITLDKTATYWCGYRIATFFHLLIFFSGFTAYMLVAFNKNFSGSVWKNPREYD